MSIRNLLPKGLFKKTCISQSEIYENFIPVFRIQKSQKFPYGQEHKFYDLCSLDSRKNRFRFELSTSKNNKKSHTSTFIKLLNKKYLPFDDFERLRKFKLYFINEELLEFMSRRKQQAKTPKIIEEKITEVDLHGLKPFTAVHKTLDAINLAILNGAEKLVVIHGKGMGRLKNEIMQTLNNCSSIKGFELDQGNRGRTIVYL